MKMKTKTRTRKTDETWETEETEKGQGQGEGQTELGTRSQEPRGSGKRKWKETEDRTRDTPRTQRTVAHCDAVRSVDLGPPMDPRKIEWRKRGGAWFRSRHTDYLVKPARKTTRESRSREPRTETRERNSSRVADTQRERHEADCAAATHTRVRLLSARECRALSVPA